MSRPSQLAYLQHMREALLAIQDYTAAGRDAFLKQRIIQDAVVRNLEVIGEAAKGLDDATRILDADVPWRRIAGMRDVLIHHYFGVDLDMVWSVVDTEVSALLTAVEKLIARLDDSSQ